MHILFKFTAFTLLYSLVLLKICCSSQQGSLHPGILSSDLCLRRQGPNASW